jgi:hypothetical protein
MNKISEEFLVNLLLKDLNINYKESSIELINIMKKIIYLDLNLQKTILETILENNYTTYLDIYLICVENDIQFLIE